MAITLTPAQQRLLDVIRAHIAATGTAPTFDEMCLATGARSKSVIHGHLVCLEKRGAIRRLPAMRRAIEIVDPQDDALGTVLAEIDAFAAADGWGNDSPMFQRLKQRLRQRLGGGGGAA